MKKLTSSYKPNELAEIIKIIPSDMVIALHKQNYKIIKLTPENCIDYHEKDV